MRARLVAVCAWRCSCRRRRAAPDAAAAAPPPERTTAISGYMDFHFNKREFEDGRLDFHRFVLLITHRFSDRIRFVSELELEHALVEGLEEAGELELEQAYVDFLLSRGFNVRAGMMLVPVGIINERHEPPTYYGVERPFVDTVIVPTTWFEVGAGVHGELGRGWRYRAYVMSPLNAREFSAEEGLRGGRQKGSDTNIGRPAVTGRLEYVGVRRPDGWGELLDRAIGVRIPAALRRAGEAWRGRRPLLARSPRAARTVCAGGHQQRRPAERRDGTRGRRRSERGERPARVLRRSRVSRDFRARRTATSACSRGTRTSTRSSRCRRNICRSKSSTAMRWCSASTYWPDPDIALKVDYAERQKQKLDD